jgi:hypothetical protein
MMQWLVVVFLRCRGSNNEKESVMDEGIRNAAEEEMSQEEIVDGKLEEKEYKSEVHVSELVEDEDVFLSTGKSKVKVTKDGVVRALVFKIKSTGVSDLVDRFNKKAPTPPVHKEIVEPGSEIGKQLGLRQKKWVRMPDLADPGYIDALAKHNEDLGMAILLQGLDVVFKNKEGNVVTDSDEKIRIMKEQEMTGHQFTQVINDIQDLTRWNEEATEDFFVGG